MARLEKVLVNNESVPLGSGLEGRIASAIEKKWQRELRGGAGRRRTEVILLHVPERLRWRRRWRRGGVRAQ